MHTRGVLAALLIIPVAAVIIFMTLATCVLALYALADVRQSRSLPDDVTARSIPRWSARVWWSEWRSKKRRKTCVLALIGAGSRIVGATLVWFLGTATVVGLGQAIRRMAGEQDPALSGPPLVAFVGAVWGGVVLLRAIHYTTTGRISKFSSLPEFSFLGDTVGVVNRFDFLRKIWLYTWLRSSARAGAYLGVAITVVYLPSSSGPSPLAQASAPQFTTEDGYAALFMASVGVAFLSSGLLGRAIAGAMPTTHAAVAIHRCLPAENGRRRFEHTKRRAGIIDVLGKRRALFARAARALDAAAARIELAFTQHPVAPMLRACSGRIQAFLAGTKSLAGTYPDDMTAVLKNVVAVLAGPADRRLPVTVAHAVEAFDHDGVPVRQAAPKRRWRSLAARAADAVDRYSRLAAALWGLFSLAVVVVLIVRGDIALSTFQPK